MQQRCPRSGTPKEILAAFAQAKRKLGKNLDTYCLEASGVMLQHLETHGHQAIAIRRELPRGQGGHWTLRYGAVEYDPTVAFWLDRPKDAVKGCLYTISSKSPHQRWRQTESTESPRVKRQLLDTTACLI